MFNLLNRLSFLLSVVMGFITTLFIAIMMDLADFDDDTFLLWFFFSFFFGFIIKKVFFSNGFLLSSLGEFDKKNLVENEYNKVEDEYGKENLVEKEDEGLKNILDKLENKSALSDFQYQAPTVASSLKSKEVLLTNEVSVSEKLIDPVKIENKEPEISKVDDEPNFIYKFFAENTLAKIGGIFLFLGILFLLQLVYSNIGPVGKILIGFLISFSIFGVGVYLDKKSFGKEARILIGVSILINYLVILSGRYLISAELTNLPFLSESVTFLFLILNTIFAVVNSLLYNSQSLLIFSFVLAYLNPFLTGAQNVNTPYTSLIYGLCISFGALSLSRFYKDKFSNYSIYLSYIAFIGGNILFLVAPFAISVEWIAKLVFMAILSFACIFNTFLNNQKQEISSYFVGTYLFFMFLLSLGANNLESAFVGFNVLFSYSVFLFFMIFGSVYFFTKTNNINNVYNLVFPLIIFLFLAITKNLPLVSLIFVLAFILALYLSLFAFLRESLNRVMQYLFFIVLGFFVLFMNFSIKINFADFDLSQVAFLDFQSYGIIFVSFLFLLVAYAFSFFAGLEYLYFLGSIFCVFMLLPILQRTGNLRLVSMISVLFFSLANIFLPFVNSLLLRSKLRNLIFSLIIGVIFLVGEIFYFLFADTGASKITLGFVFLLLAILYFVLTYAMFLKIEVEKKSLITKKETIENFDFKNILYSFLGISISLFSLSVAYVFSSRQEMIVIVWLLESSVLLYFYEKIKDYKIFLASFLTLFLGVIKLGFLLELSWYKDFFNFIPLVIIFLSNLLSLYFLRFEKRSFRYFYDVLHFLVLLFIFVIIEKIIPLERIGFSFFVFSLFFVIISVCYSLFYSAKIRYGFLLISSIFALVHIIGIDLYFNNINLTYSESFKIFHYLATSFFILSVVLFNILAKELKLQDLFDKKLLNSFSVIASIYFFIITTKYIYLFFDNNPFSITIYWGLLAFVFLYYGIVKNFIKYRTIGLYILVLTILKILIFDIWSSLDDALLRVVALMIVGVLMIIISLLYTKKYGGNLKGEFNFTNLQ